MPTWNLRGARQSIQAARVTLPEELSAFVPEGVTRLAMMGDLSRGKRWWEVDVFCSGGGGEARPVGLSCQPGLGFSVGGGIAQHAVADACELVGQRARGLVVVGTRLDVHRPLA